MGKDLSSSTQIYLVEKYWPGVTESAMRAAAKRVKLAAEEERGRTGEISYVTSYLVGKDDVAFCLFRASSVSAVEQVCRRAELAVDRIVGIVPIDVD